MSSSYRSSTASIEAVPPFRRRRTNPETVSNTTSNMENEHDINILLMGQTGVGKSTMINAMFNYLSHNSLRQAERHKIIAIIPSSFSHSDENVDDVNIQIGEPDKHERFSEGGESGTQVCRSFVFPIGNRKLRIIDTPGIGDTRGPEQDEKNFEEILRFVSQFNHLNAVCILSKPDEARLNILFRFCFNELLRHLNSSAKDNLIFFFTFGRATFYRPGQTKRLITKMIEDFCTTYKVNIPFTMNNTFVVDNEGFRYLALAKHGIRLDDQLVKSYEESWAHSVTEYQRFLKYILTRPVYRVTDFVTLNTAEQLIRKLPRPLAETQRLIEYNIQLAQQHKRRVLENPSAIREGIPQNKGRVIQLPHPRTVCSNQRCSAITQTESGQQRNYSKICHDHCFLKGVIQEKLFDDQLRECEAFDYRTGQCNVCGCFWWNHIHITYEYTATREHVGRHSINRSTSASSTVSLSDIDRRISDLRQEAKQIEETYEKLAKFYHKNAMVPGNDLFEDYLKYFIEEENQKPSSVRNDALIASLQRMQKDFHEQMVLFKRIIVKEKDSPSSDATELQLKEVFDLINQLFRLPINGAQIREQVEGIQLGEHKTIQVQEQLIILPEYAASSRMMQAALEIVASQSPFQANR